MQFPLTACLALSLGLIASGEMRADTGLDWQTWQYVAVQEGGRHKPLDTLARESLRTLFNRGRLEDPATSEKRDATATYLAMLFDWQGWDHEQSHILLESLDWPSHYFQCHQADKWDRARLFRVDFLSLRAMLPLEKGQKRMSAEELHQALVVDPRTEREVPFSAWARSLLRLPEEEWTQVDRKALELADRLWAYQEHRMGRRFRLLPIRGNEQDQWMPIAHLMLTRFDDATDPEGGLRDAQKALWEARTAYRTNEPRQFCSATSRLLVSLEKLGPQLGEYPPPARMAQEVAYNKWTPFRWAWIGMLLALVTLLLGLGSRWKAFYLSGLTIYAAALVAVAIGFAMRISISGRAPVTNMYESVIYVGSGVALFGLIFEFIYRRKYIVTAAAAVSTLALLLADHCPAVLDPSVRPLEPVLRNNFWLITHVMTITLSYAAFALALGIANITLGYLLAGSTNRSTIASLSRFTYKSLQVGVLLLAAGIILGGVWADYSWGRFWGWDPKEVWALIALLGYIAVLHARYAGWVGHRGLAVLSVACFSLVVMAWYGVNFVLGAGLHSYGFGAGGQGYVYAAVTLQLAYACAAALRKPQPPDPAPSAPGLSARYDVPSAA